VNVLKLFFTTNTFYFNILENITCVVKLHVIYLRSKLNIYIARFWKYYLFTFLLYSLFLFKNFAWKSRVADAKSSFLFKTIVYGQLEILTIGFIVRDYRAHLTLTPEKTTVMTAGAIFRNCGESSTSTAHSSRLRYEPTLHVSGVILLSNGWTTMDALPRLQLFALEVVR